MKKSILVFAALAACVAFAEDWIYNPETHYVTDGVWTFYATADDVNGTIAFGRVVDDATTGMAVPTALTDVDFSKPVRTADSSKSYTIKQLGNSATSDQGPACGLFGYFGNHQDDARATAVAGLVGKLTLPGEGLVMVGNGVFNGCVNMTGAVVFPSTVTTVGRFAFKESKISGDIKLLNVKDLGTSAFMKTAITSVEFGPDLATMDGNGHIGVFAECESLTNVVFDANASTTIMGGGTFYKCTSLEKVDLAGVIKILPQNGGEGNPWYSHFDSSAVEDVFLSDRLEVLTSCAFSGANSLKTLHFFGMPPAELKKSVLSGTKADAVILTYVHLDKEATTYDYDEAKAEWGKLTAGGALLEDGSTWSEEMVGGTYALRDLLLYVSRQEKELGYWVYDDRCTPSVVSNGIWCFHATRLGKAVTVCDVSGYPSQPTELDFSRSLTDLDKVALTFVSISPHFGTGTGADVMGGPAAEYVSKLMLPTNGLTTIGEYAFSGCTNLTEIVPCVPDTVTTVGFAAFQNVRLAEGKGDVRLYGISTLDEHVFVNVPVTSVTFGPNLKEVKCHWHEGAFYGCVQLTNVVFDAGMSGAILKGWTEGPFTGCSNLACPLDLSGFEDLAISFINGTKVPEVIVGAGCKNIVAGFFSGDNSLTNVVFKGYPPDVLGEPVFNSVGANQKVTTQIYWANRNVPNSAGKCWLDYAADGVINKKNSTWGSDYLDTGVSPENRLLIAPDAPSPLGMTILFH